MDSERIQRHIKHLLEEVEEEDVGINLFRLHCQCEDELEFFSASDRARVIKIFDRMMKDSEQHKKLLQTVIEHLGEKLNAR